MLCVCNLQKKKEASLFEEALLFQGVGVIVAGRLTLLSLELERCQAVRLLLALVGQRRHLEPELHPHFDGCSWVRVGHRHSGAIAKGELWRLAREWRARGYLYTQVGQAMGCRHAPEAWRWGQRWLRWRKHAHCRAEGVAAAACCH